MTILETYLQYQIGVSPHKAQLMASFYKEEFIPKDTFLIKQNGYAKKIIFLKEGYMRCFFSNEKKEVTHWVYWKGHMINDVSSFYLNQPSKWNFQALTDCQVYALHYDDYQKISNLLPDWHKHEKLWMIKLFTILENRIRTLLSMNAEERYQFLFKTHPELFNQVPLIYLASILSMTPETLSRIRRKKIIS